MTRQTKADDHDVIAAEAEMPPAENAVAQQTEGAVVGVDLARGPDEGVAVTSVNGETVAVERTPRNPDRCIVVRPSFDSQRAYCSVDQGSNQVEEPFRVNGRITEEEKAAAGADAAHLLTIFAQRIAGVVAEEAKQRDVDVVRLPNGEAGKATAAALREAGFYVVEFSE